MAKLHRFSQSVEPITITGSDDELDIRKDMTHVAKRPSGCGWQISVATSNGHMVYCCEVHVG